VGIPNPHTTYYTILYIYICSNADISQLTLVPYETKNKNRKIRKRKLKTKTDMLRRNGPVKSPWSQSLIRKRVYNEKDL